MYIIIMNRPNPIVCKGVVPTTVLPRSRPFNKHVRHRGTLFADEYETDHNGGPPNTPEDRLCKYWSYCMRACNKLVDETTNETLREYTGFDGTPTIVDKVRGVCERDITRFGKSVVRCTTPRLFFIGPVENCDGHVSIFDLTANTVSVLR
jgi:hypothetical protein